VVKLVAKGLSKAEMAGRLYPQRRHGEGHIARVLAKLGLRDQVQVVVLAYQTGIGRPGSPTRAVKSGTGSDLGHAWLPVLRTIHSRHFRTGSSARVRSTDGALGQATRIGDLISHQNDRKYSMTGSRSAGRS